MICQADELGHDVVGRLVFLFHHEDRVRNRTEACVCGRISDDRFLIHLRDERKENLLFLLNMRIHLATKLLNQLGDLCQFGRSIASLRRHLRSHLRESWKLLTNAMVMNADDVLNQAARGKEFAGSKAMPPHLLGLRISEFFEDLIDRELQFLARSFERQIRLQAQVDIESMKDFGCGWLLVTISRMDWVEVDISTLHLQP